MVKRLSSCNLIFSKSTIICLILLGVTLSAENNSVTWDVVADEDYARGQKLVIKQILLGAEAKDNEFNVVEVSAAVQIKYV